MEKDAVDLLEDMRVVRGGKKEVEGSKIGGKEEEQRWEKKKAAEALEHMWMLQGGKKVGGKKHVEFM